MNHWSGAIRHYCGTAANHTCKGRDNCQTGGKEAHLLDFIPRVSDTLCDALVSSNGRCQFCVVLNDQFIQVTVALLIGFFKATFLIFSVLNIITSRQSPGEDRIYEAMYVAMSNFKATIRRTVSSQYRITFIHKQGNDLSYQKIQNNLQGWFQHAAKCMHRLPSHRAHPSSTLLTPEITLISTDRMDTTEAQQLLTGKNHDNS